MGVWGLNALGQWEDRAGTSGAAPILARQAALALQELQRVCASGTKPYAVTAKAFLALTSQIPAVAPAIQELADRTLGRGLASSERLRRPLAGSAVLLWQGVLEGTEDIARIEIPIPKAWIEQAEMPTLRLIVAWDTPANAAVRTWWACRRVSATFRVEDGVSAAHPKHGRRHETYPLIERKYDIGRAAQNHPPKTDTWILELSYEQIADYTPVFDFSPQQRVAFAAELYDDGSASVSPQASIQALPAAKTMNQLSMPSTMVRAPVVLRVRS